MSPNPAESKRTARERLRAERAEKMQQARRRERNLRIVAALTVLLVVVGIGIMVFVGTNEEADPTAARPSGVTEVGGGISIGTTAGAPVVDVYEDYKCPHCRDFEMTNGDTLEKLAADGAATVVYHPWSFLGEESDRASAAAGCAADAGKFPEFHRALYENQDGWSSNSDIAAIGEKAGITGGDFSQCVNDGTYAGWADQVDDEARNRGLTGTPTVLIDGKKLAADQYTPEGLRAAVEAAAKKS